MINYILGLLAIPALLQGLWLLLISLAALVGRRKSRQSKSSRFLLLVPAHNEEAVIRECLQSLEGLDYPRDLLKTVVIADNCSDQTAQIAGEFVQVIERFSETKRSKGFALQEVLPQIIQDNPSFDAVVVLDADSSLKEDALQYFSGAMDQGQDWVQAYYTGSNSDQSWRTRLMEWAFSLFNGVYLQGVQNLGMSVPLRGNGMCFRISALRRVPWACSGLAEDLEFSWALRLKGERVYFNPASRVYGEFVKDSAGSESQRKRWEEGRLAAHKHAKASLNQINKHKLLYLLDLSMWPIGKLACYFLVVAGLFIAFSAGAFPWLLVSIGLLGFLAYLCMPFVIGFCSPRVLMALGHVPFYLLWKIRVALSKKSSAWIRTSRNVEKQPNEFSFAGISFSHETLASSSEKIVNLAQESRVSWIVTPNSDHVIRLQDDKRYFEMASQASLTLADGKPIVWASQILGQPLPERVTGADLLPQIAHDACRKGVPILLLGGLEGEAEAAADNLKNLNSRLEVHTYYPPFGFETDPNEFENIKSHIVSTGAKIVFVGVGSPKQENWIYDNRDQLPHGVYLGVGMAIAFAAGTQKRAPKLLQRLGLEWCYRLIQEPGRLWKRYLGNIKIIQLIIKEIRNRNSNQPESKV